MSNVNLSAFGGVGWQFFDNNGAPLAGGLIYTYAAGTTTPQATYTTSAGTTAHTNPIVLNSAGRVSGGQIWLFKLYRRWRYGQFQLGQRNQREHHERLHQWRLPAKEHLLA